MQFRDKFSEVSQLIKGKNKILLASHERPDGDALGSMTAMFSVLRTFPRKEVVMFSKDPTPSNLSFLPFVEHIVSSTNFSPELFIAFDYGDFSRLGVDDEVIRDADIVTFDHHPEFNQRGDIKIIDTSCSSTCEMIYDFFISEGYPITPETAKSLLTGIFTDTGGLSHVNTSRKTLEAAGNLLRYGASLKKVHKHTFAGKPERVLKTWGGILKNISREEDVGMAYVAVSSDKFEELDASLENFEGIVNLIAMPPDVMFSLLLIEHKPGVVKCSMRSEPFKGVDVSRIARALGGGGHKYAAGFEMRGETLKNVVNRVKIIASDLQ